MVSIHIVPVIVCLIIKVISSTFRFKREALHCCSLHVLRPFHVPFVIETSNVRPHADMQFFLLSCYEPTDVQTHLWLYNKERYGYNIPTWHLPLLGF